MLDMLTQYRAVPAMYRALTGLGAVKQCAEKDVAKILGIAPENVQHVLEGFKDWIKYAMSDFLHYTSKLLDSDEFEDSYWPRMSEEARLVTNLEPFKVDVDKITILDMGAGNAPYRKNFRAANNKSLRYIAVDKRYTRNRQVPEVKNVSLTLVCGDTESYRLAHPLPAPNVLFLANFLHCLQDIPAFFEEILPLLPELKVIKILEVKPDTALDFCFDYHMFEHSRGQRFEAEQMDSILNSLDSPSFKAESLGDYHVMLTVEL